jgi:hypothetical protein
VENAALREEAVEEGVVEGGGRGQVHGREAAVSTRLRAGAPERGRVRRVEVGVAVQPAPEVGALRLPDRVGPCWKRESSKDNFFPCNR